MENWFVYILLCKDMSLYTGITKNVEQRMTAHKSGNGSKYVARRGFSKLLHTISCKDRTEAAKLEYRIKQLPRNSKIQFFMNHPNRCTEQTRA